MLHRIFLVECKAQITVQVRDQISQDFCQVSDAHDYILDNKYEFGWPLITQDGPEEQTLSRLMMQYWANFARTGDPNSKNSFKNWENFDPERRNFMRFDLGEKTRPEENFRHKWAAAWLDMMVEIEDADSSAVP